jgi:hypothetical protein
MPLPGAPARTRSSVRFESRCCVDVAAPMEDWLTLTKSAWQDATSGRAHPPLPPGVDPNTATAVALPPIGGAAMPWPHGGECRRCSPSARTAHHLDGSSHTRQCLQRDTLAVSHGCGGAHRTHDCFGPFAPSRRRKRYCFGWRIRPSESSEHTSARPPQPYKIDPTCRIGATRTRAQAASLNERGRSRSSAARVASDITNATTSA